MSQAQGFKCSAHASCILGKYHSLSLSRLNYIADWSKMKGRFLIGSPSGPGNFVVQTAKMDHGHYFR